MANEKRLIDANALMDVFRSYMVERYDREKCVSEENCKTCENSCLWRRMISAAPTVDAAEVVHGKWLFKHNPITDPKGYFIRIVCSECNLHTGQKSNYCPQCGAKMEGERREGE